MKNNNDCSSHGGNLHSNEHFFDHGAARYDRRMIQFWMKKYYRPAIKEITAPGSILDVSCGTGNLLQELSQRDYQNLQGVDYSSKMVEIAQAKLKGIATIQKADVHHLPFKDNTFDYVVSTEAFHHYHNQQKAIQELARVTKSQGKVIVCDINFSFKIIHRLFHRFEPGHVKINSKEEFKILFEKAGLTNITQTRDSLFAIKTVGVKP
ncbi:class I SAM-dependent methyltransferase [Candidatus Woesearchaeota archaeon]|nr:class I SAM-dependent methyltransferase [Candidatus Woesearchaeota archaeon]